MAKKTSDYFGLDYIISVVIAIFPVISNVCGIITRWNEGAKLAAAIRTVCFLTYFSFFLTYFGQFAGIVSTLGFLIWLVDLILMITKKQIWRAI